MKNTLSKPLMAAALTAALLAPQFSTQAAQEVEPLKLNLPLHTLKGTPEDLPTGPNIEPPSDKAPPPIPVPKGVKNVAAGKSVTSSVSPFLGELAQITDGKKEPIDDDAVEFRKGVQWVQIDLGEEYEIHAAAMWHDHRYVQVMRDVILQASNDPGFASGVTTLYNNDIDNTAKLGVGTDREYFELEFGRVAPVKGVKARYVRGYTRGSTQSALNCWQEIEVYALPVK
jgi:hypothetical protein